MGKIDLHIHTNASDGNLTPKQIVQIAIEKKLSVIAITDHDSISGIQEAIKNAKGKKIKIVPGIEISCNLKDMDFSKIYIIGLFINHKNKKLLEFCRRQKGVKSKKLFIILNLIGFRFFNKKLFLEMAKKIYPYFLLLIKNLRYISYREQRNKINTISLSEGIKLIKNSGGIAILAHPWDFDKKSLNLLIDNFKRYGGDGMEVKYGYTQDYWKDKKFTRINQFFEQIAKDKKLLVSGGSDFHGQLMRPVSIGECGIDNQEFLKLENFINKKKEQF